jgi:peptidyl-prolyl cis-trans isomerase C
MKKDLLVAIIGIAVVAAICFGITKVHPPQPPAASPAVQANAAAPDAATSSAAPATAAHSPVIMHVNGEAVTEEEFRASFAGLPEQVQQQFAGEQGQQAAAERMVGLKILEQEARRQGLDKDPKVQAQLALGHTNVLAEAAFSKLTKPPTDAEVRAFYEQNKSKLERIELSHILIAYQGGTVPPRAGAPLTPDAAMQKAQAVEQKLKAGGDFAALAKQVSDDASSAAVGGALGAVSPGQLPPELDQVVFSLPQGQVSQPVPSRFGIHIFKVTKKESQPLEQVREALAQRVGQKAAMDRIDALRKGAKVDFDPKFFPNAAKWQPQQRPAVKKPL